MTSRALVAVAVGLAFTAELTAVGDRPRKRKESPASKYRQFQGTWRLITVRINSPEPSQAVVKVHLVHPRVIIQGKELTVPARDDPFTLSFRLRLSQEPKAIDLTRRGGSCSTTVLRGIYSLHRSVLKVCLPTDGKGRPSRFNSEEGRETVTLVWIRARR
jgi:uncharacterized protein (TIGR03067 family)